MLSVQRREGTFLEDSWQRWHCALKDRWDGDELMGRKGVL